MAQELPDCQHISSNLTYDCSNPYPSCTSAKHFDFSTLWNYTNLIYQSCPNDTRLYRANALTQNLPLSKNSISLTQDACVAVAGGGWKRYPRSDIWTRLTTWKFPLLQLAFSFPRPPLSFAIESFVVIHLLGDPIDTIANLLRKVSMCQRWARHWQNNRDGGHHWKALALITDSYAEWGKDEQAKDVLEEALARFGATTSLEDNIIQTAQALAADRSTKSLPVVAAQIFFIVTIGVSIFRTADVANNKASALNSTIFINVEAFSIAFSALYFWLIPTVILGSVIGVSQTKAAIPRILTRFQDDLNSCQGLENMIALPNYCLADHEKRNFHGGIYSWQPSSYRNQIISSLRNQSQYADQIELNRLNQPAAIETLMRNQLPLQFSVTSRTSSNKHDSIIAHLIVVAGAVAGFIISSLVPPEGWNCRHFGELSILFVWIFSACIDIQLNKKFSLSGEPWKFLKWRMQSSTALFWLTFFKDIVSTVATMFGIVIIQCGILNRCVCYSNWGRKGLQLPEMPDVDNVLRDRINRLYPAIVALGLGFQLISVSLYFYWQYGSALQVYVQRDDDKSNTPSWVKRVNSWGRRVVPKRAQFRR